MDLHAQPDKYGNLHLIYGGDLSQAVFYRVYQVRYEHFNLNPVWSRRFSEAAGPALFINSITVGPRADVRIAVSAFGSSSMIDPPPHIIGIEEFDMNQSGDIDALTVTVSEDMNDSTISLDEMDQVQFDFLYSDNDAINFDSVTDPGGVSLRGTSDPLIANDNVFTAVTDDLSVRGTSAAQVRFLQDDNRYQDFGGSDMPTQGFGEITYYDRAGPVPYETWQHDNDRDGNIDVVVVHFSEPLNDSTIDLAAVKRQFRLDGDDVFVGVDGVTDPVTGTAPGNLFVYDTLPQFAPPSTEYGYSGRRDVTNPQGVIDPGRANDAFITIITDDWSDSVRNTNDKQISFSATAGTFTDIPVNGNPPNDGVGHTVAINHDYAPPRISEALELDGGSGNPNANPPGPPDGYLDDIVP